MSLDLYPAETVERIGAFSPVQSPEPGAFDGFVRGAGLATMRSLARTARSIDLAGAIGPISQDAITGGTTAQDRYFKEHEETWGNAVDYWTPKPNEVGVAGEMVGQLLGTLGLVVASPSLAVAEMQLGMAEDLMRKGVAAPKAQAVGALQAAGLGLGVWMPILGQNLWQRLVVGGAGYNLAQGAVTRGASGLILEGTPQAEEFKMLDPAALTLDVLLGAAFGGLAHVSPAMRVQGKAAWERLSAWAQNLTPSDVVALATLRQAQHLNVDSAPGKPASPADVQAHIERTRQAIEQLSTDQPVEVSDLPEPKFTPDPAREAESVARTEELATEAERIRVEEDLPEAPTTREPPIVAFRREAMAIEAELPPVEPGLTRLWRGNRLGEVAQNPSFTSSLDGIALPFRNAYGGELSYVDVPTADLPSYPHGPVATDAEFMLPKDLAEKAKVVQKAEAPAAKPGGVTESPPPRGSVARVEAAGAKAHDPIASAADKILAETPDRLVSVGQNPDGTPIVKTLREYLEAERAEADLAREDAKLFELAADCMIRGS